MRGQPKVHKDNVPVRPIVNYQNAPAYYVCKYLNKVIKSNINFPKSYSIKNSYELIDHIKDLNISNNATFVSFDIVNMYSNIPVGETIKILESNLNNFSNLSKIEIED